MNLGELRTELRKNILHDRSDRVDGDPDYLWDDETLDRYINLAQQTFARQSLALRDSSSDFARVTIEAEKDKYPLDPKILGVVSARFEDEQRDLARTGNVVIGGYRLPATTIDRRHAYDGVEPGRPHAFSTDDGFETDEDDQLGRVVLRLFPAPSEDFDEKVLRLRTIRLPRKMEIDFDEPEIPEIYHLTMLDWAAYRALSIVDVDAGMPQRAQEFLQMFDRATAEARRDVTRKLFAPMSFGFGQYGWTWER